MGDLVTCWWLLLVMAFVSAIVSFLYLYLLKWIGRPILYFSFLLILVLLVGAGVYAYVLSDDYQEGDSTRDILKYCAYGIWGLTVIYLLILLCCCSRIQLGLAIMDATSQFIADVTSVFTVPVVFFFLILVWTLFWIISAVYVFSVGEAKPREDIPIADIEWNDTTRYVWFYHLFGLFWISAFIIGCAQFIIAAAAVVWYFEKGGKSDSAGKDAIRTGVYWIFRYHMGSIAFGALIIAIMQVIKILFEYFRRKVEKASGGNTCVVCLCKIARCCVWCLDCCVKYITKNAYIQVALTSKSFCPAAWATFWLIVRNAARFSIITSIGAILMFIGKALIMAFSGFLGYVILVNSDLGDEVYSPIFPTIVFVISAYLISSVFLSVFSFAATTILHCYIVDEELNGGEAQSGPQGLAAEVDNNLKKQEYKKGAQSGEGPNTAIQGKDARDPNVMH